MQSTVQRIEQILEERNALLDQYAALWAVHGGGSQTWESHLVDIDTAALKERLRDQSKGAKVAELKEALHAEPEYQRRIRRVIEGRTEWVRVREQWNTLGWRLQLEMAKLRLELGDDATPTNAPNTRDAEVEE